MENNQSLEKRLSLFLRIFPFYTGLSMDLMFFIAIDTLFFTVAKNFSAFQITFLGVIPTLICIGLQPVLVKIIKKLGNANSSRLGAITLLISSIIFTFGSNFYVIAIGQLIYDISFVLKNTESITLRNNLKYSNNSDLFFKLRGRANTIYAIVTFIIALSVGPLFNINPYLPMYLCIFFALINVFLSFFFYDLPYKDEDETNDLLIDNKKIKLSKILKLALLSSTLFLGIAYIGQTESKLFIQYYLDNTYGIGLTATYLGFIVATSRIARIFINLIFNKIYIKVKNNISVIMSFLLTISFSLIVIGYLLPVPNFIKFLIMAIGFSFIVSFRDPFIIYIEDLLLKNSRKKQQQKLFVYMELLRKLGKVALNFVISLILLKFDLFIVMILFIVLSLMELILSKYITKINRS